MLKKKLVGFILTRTLSNILIISGLLVLTTTFWPLIGSELRYRWRWFRGKGPGSSTPGAFNQLSREPWPLYSLPVSKEFSLVCDKIGLNAPVIANVSLTDKGAYKQALREGIAHAQGSALPGQPGAVYVFAHTSLDFWALGKYATVFNLLRKLEPNDRLSIFYLGARYDYQVTRREIVSGFNTEPLKRQYGAPMLLMQTCDPPGTTLNRLVVTAKQVASYPSKD